MTWTDSPPLLPQFYSALTLKSALVWFLLCKTCCASPNLLGLSPLFAIIVLCICVNPPDFLWWRKKGSQWGRGYFVKVFHVHNVTPYLFVNRRGSRLCCWRHLVRVSLFQSGSLVGKRRNIGSWLLKNSVHCPWPCSGSIHYSHPVFLHTFQSGRKPFAV